jgi:hypothetical protein
MEPGEETFPGSWLIKWYENVPEIVDNSHVQPFFPGFFSGSG